MLKVGVLGCGMIAEWGHFPAILRTPEVQLNAVYDIRWQRALDMQRRFHAKHAYPDEDSFWKGDFEAVVICTPAPLHPEHVARAARHGKHILCEKPLAMTEAEIEEMIAVAAAAKVELYTGFTYRFSPSAMEIHRLVREGGIGKVRSLRLLYLWNLHGKWRMDAKGHKIPSPLRVGRMEEGGPMVDCGVHQIDLARWWLGSEVCNYQGVGVWVEDFEAPDHMYLHMGHDCGAHTTVEMSFSYNATSVQPRSNFLYELIGTDGVIRYSREEHSFEIRNSHGTQHLSWHPEKNFAGMYHGLYQALRGEKNGKMPTAQDGLAATRIARAATEQVIRSRDLGTACPVPLAACEDLFKVAIPADYAEPEPPAT
ncbi:MAG: Gfo/Idh/MocA family protein [Opitutales bacterium]